MTVESRELPEELSARLKREAYDGWAARIRDSILFLAVLAGVSAAGWHLLRVATDPATSAEGQKWAMAAVSSILSAGVGYLVGRHQKS